MFEKALFFSFLSISLLGLSIGYSQRAENHDTFQRFSPCPNRPNCVSSLNPKSKHFIKPITYTESVNPMKKLSVIMKQFPRTRTVTEEENYLHFEVRSILFRFVDDVEFYYDKPAGLIHMKSAARAGYYDFGVNRKRLEKVRKKFNS